MHARRINQKGRKLQRRKQKGYLSLSGVGAPQWFVHGWSLLLGWEEWPRGCVGAGELSWVSLTHPWRTPLELLRCIPYPPAQVKLTMTELRKPNLVSKYFEKTLHFNYHGITPVENMDKKYFFCWKMNSKTYLHLCHAFWLVVLALVTLIFLMTCLQEGQLQSQHL